MIWERVKYFYRRGWLSFGLLSTAFLFLFILTWQKWGDLIVDTGREMFVPLKLAEGAVLYRDIFYLYGPLSPYFHSFLFNVFGVHLNVLITSGALTAAFTLVLMFKISRFFLNVFLSTVTALVFLLVCVFGHYLFLANYNFIIPYSYPAVHALLFSLAAIYFFFRYTKDLKAGDCWLSSLAVFLILVTRVEMGVMAMIALLAGAVFFNKKMGLVSWIVLFGLPLLLAGMVYGGFWLAAREEILQSNLFSFASTNTFMDNPFTSWLSGTDQRAENLWLMSKSFLFHGLAALWFFLTGMAVARAGRIRDMQVRNALYLVVTVFAPGLIYFLMNKFAPAAIQYRSLPVLIIVAFFIAAVRLVRSEDSAMSPRVLTLAVFSWLVLLRIIFKVHPMHYGFSLLAPGLIVYHVLLFRLIPDMISNKTARACLAGGFIFVVGAYAFQYLSMSMFAYQHRTISIFSSRGGMKVFPNDRDRACANLIRHLATQTHPDSTVTILPEGLTINFLANRDNPLYYYSFMPPDFSKKSVESDVIKDIEEKKVDYIVLLQRDLEEYNIRVFGTDYARNLWQYIQKNYSVETRIGPFPYTTPDFGAAVFKRNMR
ncbi:MAG: hypothetical protein AB1650_01435 [Candidatus Omnitrophota bacterium]